MLPDSLPKSKGLWTSAMALETSILNTEKACSPWHLEHLQCHVIGFPGLLLMGTLQFCLWPQGPLRLIRMPASHRILVSSCQTSQGFPTLTALESQSLASKACCRQ